MPRELIGRGSLVVKPAEERSLESSPNGTAPPTATASAASPRSDRTIAAIPAKFHGRARRDAAAFYLSQLAKGVLCGEIAIAVGDQQLQLATSEFVVLKIEAKQRKRANHVSVKLRWPRRPLIRVAAARGRS
jgi:amphi-Trp domain-containing protein